MVRSRVYLECDVAGDADAIPGNQHHCAIVNAIILSDSDIVACRVNQEEIRYSRRSNGMRYRFHTPSEAANFIRDFDKLIESADGRGRVRKMNALAFTLRLTDSDLISTEPRSQRHAEAAIKQTARKVWGPTTTEVVSGDSEVTKKVGFTNLPPSATPARRKATPRKKLSQRV